ncbi:hypothetical protein RvY_15690 [Ramazzottius varieornatus]|uniref:Acylglycerol kinase, mitochondrial n=1 Tax=Ramazzottius varieornatus TaxID=947166 RepID=A0A1D1VXC4_RAMVA|nr:hypothetical protein RvY_15690 [Ramazzottius varieornatus]
MSKYIAGVWNHKKKVIFLSGLTAWGASYAIDRQHIHEEMREMCLYAKTIGDQPVLPGDRIRKAVVILNYSDHKGKARKLYDNFAAPILNLAGIQQTVYSTNELSRLREYVEHMEDADAVIFAGGDSTLFECLQSFFKLDRPALVKTPVGILPLGNSNVTYDTFNMDRAKEGIKIAHAAMEIVRGKLFPADVMEIRVGDKEEKDFALTNLQWGPLKDVRQTVPKYWYFGPFSSWIAFAVASLRGTLRAKVTLPIQFVNVCEGCARCESVDVQESTTQTAENPRAWIEAVVPRRRMEVSAVQHQPERRFTHVNEDCGGIHESTLQAVDFQVLTQNAAPDQTTTTHGLVLSTIPQLGFQDFRDLSGTRIDADNVKGTNDRQRVRELRIKPTELDLDKYSTIDIDGHSVGVTGPIHSKLHSRKLLLFNHKQAA